MNESSYWSTQTMTKDTMSAEKKNNNKIMVCNNTKTSYQLQRSVQLLNASSKKKNRLNCNDNTSLNFFWFTEVTA